MTRKIDPKKIRFVEDTIVEDVDRNATEIYVEGERLTDERAEQMADEVVALARAKKPSPGRQVTSRRKEVFASGTSAGLRND